MNTHTQYILVFIILGVIIVWLLFRLFSKRGRKAGSSHCSGCALEDACRKKYVGKMEECAGDKEC